ncbi:MAG: S41 family peptidase [Phycisphaerales bacterium]
MRCALAMMVVVCTHAAMAAGPTVPLPAAPGRGYAIHPAVAGDRLVFVADGDLWVASLAGDPSKPIDAARLTSGTGVETAPVLSPDGTTLAFLADYDGTPEVYVMPVMGGSPKRLTFHPSMERPLAFTADGGAIIYRSDRANPLGRDELWSVPVSGGPSRALGFGEGSLASVDAATGRVAFTPWSNESWSWKRYRGGTAPDLWITDAEGKSFTRLTRTRENELFPMWLQGRVWFLADPDGRMNLWSVAPDGSDRRQHTRHGAGDLEPRWAKADPGATGTRVVYTRGADVVLFDAKDGSERVLDLRLVGDRFADRLRNRPPTEGLTWFSLAPGGETLLLETRGEFLALPLGPEALKDAPAGIQVPSRASTRERDAAWLDESTIVYVTDRGDGFAVVARDLSEPDGPEATLATSDVWVFEPQASVDGRHVAFGDKSGSLRMVDVATGAVRDIERSANRAIRDYRFSPDGRWIAWVRPLANGNGQVVVRPVAGGDTVVIGDGMTNDSSPRWDPAGAYLYFLSDRHIDPVMDALDLNFATQDVTMVCGVPLKASTPPPFTREAREAGMDLMRWSTGKPGGWMESDEDADEVDDEKVDEGEEGTKDKAGQGEASDEIVPIEVELAGIGSRVFTLPVKPGQFDGFEAAPGALLLGRHPRESVGEEVWPEPPMGMPGTHLERFDVRAGKSVPLLEAPVTAWNMDSEATRVVTWDGQTMLRLPVEGGEPEMVDVASVRVSVDPREEWRQIFDEAWRLQRDFFWRADMGGVDWAAVRQAYLPLVDRVGTREELNDAIVQMCSELANSHVYISGGEMLRSPEGLQVGVLGAQVAPREGGWVIERVLPDFGPVGGPENPLAVPFRGVKAGQFIVAVDGREVTADREIGEWLVGRAGRATVLTIADTADGANARDVEIRLPGSESELLYHAWVEMNRRTVAERSGGRLGYIHVPDMDAAGITAFMRGFFPQLDREGMVVDIRNNGGGYVSPVLIERLMRKPWAWSVPRDGRAETNPSRSLVGPMAVLIDQGAGSDGDIFPETVRRLNLAPLIGTRTWGGVIGIEGDKSFVDGGMSTQPGWGYWTPVRGYAVENEGVAPDIEVELTPADRAAGRDPQLDRAIAELVPKLPAKRFEPPRPETAPPTAP